MSLDDKPLAGLVRKLATHASLNEEDRAAILTLPLTLRNFEPSSYLVREGDLPAYCAVLLSGFAFRQKLTGDGARQILALHIPGEAVDFQNIFLNAADHNVQTLTRCRVALISRSVLIDLLKAYPHVAHAVLISTLIEASIFREWILNVGRRDARARLAHVLCELAVRLEAQGLNEDVGYELPMTQEQLGDVLGLTPVHVNRTLRAMDEEGLIVRSKRHIRFPNWHALRDVGDFNANYLHIEKQQSFEVAA